MRLSYTHEVPMGHRLQGHRGRCRFLHGHNYLVTATVEGPVRQADAGPAAGMVVDFAALKAALADTLRPYDHAFVLQEGDPAAAAIADHASVVLLPDPPTAEVLCLAWLADVRRLLRQSGLPGLEVRLAVRETRDCEAAS